MAYITRRQWLKSATRAAGACALGSFSLRAEEALYTGGAPNAEKLGWRIGVQLYSFHTITFQEAVQKAASIGLKWGEAYPGHKLAPDRAKSRLQSHHLILKPVRFLICFAI